MRNLEQARTNRATEEETNRSNVAKEQETKRSNLAKETETNRSNLANEAETKRHNIVSEVNTAQYNTILNNHYVRQDIETNRSNLANEQLKMMQNIETTRSNLAREAETARANTMNYMIATRNANIEQQRVDNDYTIKVGQLALDTHRVNLEQHKVANEQRRVEVLQQQADQQYELGWLNYGISRDQIAINQENVRNQRNRWNSQTDIERQRAVTDYIGTAAAAANNYSQAALAEMRKNLAPGEQFINGIRSTTQMYNSMPNK